ncbi:MAG: GNAT family N-acetyltransferase, partial [Chloroflexota bacterium]
SPALCIDFKQGAAPFFFVMGEEQGVMDILGSGLCPWQVYLAYQPHQRPAIESFYRLHQKTSMRRMHVTNNSFKAADGGAVRLTGADANEVNWLYLRGMNCYVQPRQIEEGTYCGIWHHGHLVSVAGTHVISQSQGIAAVGNVFTHPQHRCQGLAVACTSAVTQELLRTCRDVVLNVRDDNAQATRVYERLGYREHCLFVEALGVWRLRTLLKRLARRFF